MRVEIEDRTAKGPPRMRQPFALCLLVKNYSGHTVIRWLDQRIQRLQQPTQLAATYTRSPMDTPIK